MFEKFNAQLNLTQSLGICLVVAVIFTFWTYALPESYNDIKRRETMLTMGEKLHLWANRLFHFFSAAFTRLFPFLIRPFLVYDIVYIIIHVAMMIQWQIYKECLITLDEKWIFEPNYVPGSNKFYEYFMRVFFTSDASYQAFYPWVFITFYFVVFFALFRIFFGGLYRNPAYLSTPSWLRPIIK
jgi:hypothetical protein